MTFETAQFLLYGQVLNPAVCLEAVTVLRCELPAYVAGLSDLGKLQYEAVLCWLEITGQKWTDN